MKRLMILIIIMIDEEVNDINLPEIFCPTYRNQLPFKFSHPFYFLVHL